MTSDYDIDYSKIPYRKSIIQEVEEAALNELRDGEEIWNDMLLDKWTDESGNLTVDIDTSAGSIKNILTGLRNQLQKADVIHVEKREGQGNEERKVWIEKNV